MIDTEALQALSALVIGKGEALTRGWHTCAIGGKIRDIVPESPLVADVDLALPSAAVLAPICSALKKGCCDVLEERALLPRHLTIGVERAVLCNHLQHSPTLTPGPVLTPSLNDASVLPSHAPSLAGVGQSLQHWM